MRRRVPLDIYVSTVKHCEASPRPHGAVHAAEAGKEAAAEGGASWWMDTFRPTLLQALLNMTVVLRNVAVRCEAGGVAATLSCGMLHAATASDAEVASRPVGSTQSPKSSKLI